MKVFVPIEVDNMWSIQAIVLAVLWPRADRYEPV